MRAHISVRLPEDLDLLLTEYCQEKDRPKSWVMVKALERFLQDESAIKRFEILEKAGIVKTGAIAPVPYEPEGRGIPIRKITLEQANEEFPVSRRQCSCGGMETPKGRCSKCNQSNQWRTDPNA